MVFEAHNQNSSLSPEKPRRLLEFLDRHGLLRHFEMEADFDPFDRDDFYIAHEKAYVDSFFSDQIERKYSRMLGLKWSKAFAETVRYTNASFYRAIAECVRHPEQVSFSPAGGFHHAIPRKGLLYCSFSGQVIAATKLYREQGVSGCFIDLDGHYGNSIDKSYDFVPDLERAVPREIGNINIGSHHRAYIDELREKLAVLKDYISDGRIHYVVFCHGADSHEWDDLGHQLTTAEWVECADIFYTFIFDLQRELNRQIPTCVTLFGGYRKDDYDNVLSLHTADLTACLNILCGNDIHYTPQVKERGKTV